MPLNLPTESVGFVPYLKFNSKAGRFSAKVKSANGFVDVEIVKPKLAFDFANIKTGWVAFGVSGPPQTSWDPSLAQSAPNPGWDKVKRGFRVRVVGSSVNIETQDQTLSGTTPILGLRELMSTAIATTNPIMEMYNEWESLTMEHPDELPLYQCTGTIPLSGANGTNYRPVFELTGWVTRASLTALDDVPDDLSHQPVNTLANLDEPPPAEPYPDDDIPF